MLKRAFNRYLIMTFFGLVEMGVLLVAIGLSVVGFLLLGDQRPVLPGPPQTRIDPRPPPPEPVLGSIPLFDGKVTSVSFFTASPDHPLENPVYGNRFSKKEVKYVFGIIYLAYPTTVKPYNYPLKFTFYKEGKVYSAGTFNATIQAGSKESSVYYGFGWNESGHYPPGQYYMEVSFEGRLIANSAFEIYQ
jgi:hypothetical protein